MPKAKRENPGHFCVFRKLKEGHEQKKDIVHEERGDEILPRRTTLRSRLTIPPKAGLHSFTHEQYQESGHEWHAGQKEQHAHRPETQSSAQGNA